MISYHPKCITEGTYRLALEECGDNVLIIVGLNPSTADEHIPDPTIKCALRIAETNGYDGFVMLNLSSERCTNPKKLSIQLNEVMHRKNLSIISYYNMKYPNADILLAFGNGIHTRNYLSNCLKDIYNVFTTNRRWFRIGGPKGITASGNPRHPLYSKADAGLERFDIERYIELL